MINALLFYLDYDPAVLTFMTFVLLRIEKARSAGFGTRRAQCRAQLCHQLDTRLGYKVRLANP